MAMFIVIVLIDGLAVFAVVADHMLRLLRSISRRLEERVKKLTDALVSLQEIYNQQIERLVCDGQHGAKE